MSPDGPKTVGTHLVFRFHILSISVWRSLYLRRFSASISPIFYSCFKWAVCFNLCIPQQGQLIRLDYRFWLVLITFAWNFDFISIADGWQLHCGVPNIPFSPELSNLTTWWMVSASVRHGLHTVRVSAYFKDFGFKVVGAIDRSCHAVMTDSVSGVSSPDISHLHDFFSLVVSFSVSVRICPCIFFLSICFLFLIYFSL